MYAPGDLIHALADFVQGLRASTYRSLGERTVERVGGEPARSRRRAQDDPGGLRRSAFEQGEPPLPGASCPPPRRIGWEDQCEL
jgi:hypothetical protein